MKITFKKSLKLFFTMILCLVFFLVAGCSFNHTPVDVKEYTVTFKDEATGEVITTITRKTTSIIQERDILLGNYEIPEGYQYSWYVKVKDEKGNIVDKPVNFKDINTDTVVYIFLTAKEYTLKLYIDNVLVKQTAYNFAEEIKDFTDISREGYYFDGWYLNANYTDNQEMPKVMPAHNVELYGRWVADKVYKEVKFMNGNVQVAIKSVAVNEKITEPAAPAKVGYTFVGWYKEAELIEKFDFENEVMGDKNLTLYAKWEINSYTILLVSNLEGLNLSNKVREYNARIGNLFSSSEKNELLSYPGYTFVGWYVDEELTKPFEKISMPAEDITLYAKWHFDGIKLVINGEIFKTISGKQGDAVDASLITVPNIEGYTFRGWFLSENPLPSDSKYEFNVLPKEQVVVYGVYDLVEYTITYYTDNGELSLEKDTYTILDDSYQIPKPNKKGYSFEGWFTDQTFTNEIISIKKGTTGNIELYAKYEIITYSITIHANGGMIESIPTEYTVESDDIVLPTTGAKVGYSFQGFYSNASFDGLPITVISKGSIGDLELYVKWLADGSVPYIVEYYFEKLNNDEPLKENGKFNNEAFLETPIKKIFSAETGMEVQAEIISYPGFTSCHTASVKGVVSGDGSTVLKVYYSRNQYTYTFMSDDNILKQITVDYEDEITEPTNPTKEGYTFIGWDKEIPTTMPAEDLTITALWQVNEYTITFDTDGGVLGNVTCRDRETIAAEFLKDLNSFAGKEYTTVA